MTDKFSKALAIHPRLRQQAFVAYQLPMGESERRPVAKALKKIAEYIRKNS